MSELTEELKLEFQNYSQKQLSNAFIVACKDGDLDIIRYLLTSSDLNQHADMHANNDLGFGWACMNGHLEVVRYLLTSPELKNRVNIHVREDFCFRMACEYGHLEIVKYLLASPELTDHADIHAYCDEGFEWTCLHNHLNVVEYLLTFSGEDYIEFQKKEYNLDWAISENHHNIVKAMTLSLYKNDMIEYLENIYKIEQYCLDNGLDFKAWEEEMIKNDVNINSHTTELFV